MIRFLLICAAAFIAVEAHALDCTNTVTLVDVDSGTTSPTGQYRWKDVADHNYAESYRNSYNYTQANVHIDYTMDSNSLFGTLYATNLKPNFAYQLKLLGTAGTATNELVGLTGRWWQEEWSGTAWFNGQNLNNKDDGELYGWLKRLKNMAGNEYEYMLNVSLLQAAQNDLRQRIGR